MMSVASVSYIDPRAVHGPGPRLFSVDEYHRMLETGILKEGDPVELIEGSVRFKMMKGIRHDAAISDLQGLLQKLLADWPMRAQSAITTQDSEPEPDLVVVRKPASQYRRHHPYPQDIVLVVEVSDSSVEYDRLEKGAVYARAGIAEYWLVNLREMVVEVFTSPTTLGDAPRYEVVRGYGMEDSVPVMVDGKVYGVVQVKDFVSEPI